ncbi:peptidase S66 [Clostridia bacterium]|nr:peptidase S66 [Clostridia bacterium]
MKTTPFLPERLNLGDTIGIVQPSHVADPVHHTRTVRVLERLGFNVKTGRNIYKDTYINVASASERADDFNEMIADDKVRMVFFGGGDCGVDVLPLIDYDNIRKHPKLLSSYSDGTCILNAVHAQTGLVTYYGMSPGEFADLRQYNWSQFASHFVSGHSADSFESDSEWQILHAGRCEGRLLGGYSLLFALMMTNPNFKYDPDERYLLFIEDYAGFSPPSSYNAYITFIEQSAIMQRTVGFIFGHFADQAPDVLLRRMERLGRAHDIPVVYTDDFGHGTRHAIFPIGVRASLDTNARTLNFQYS